MFSGYEVLRYFLLGIALIFRDQFKPVIFPKTSNLILILYKRLCNALRRLICLHRIKLESRLTLTFIASIIINARVLSTAAIL